MKCNIIQTNALLIERCYLFTLPRPKKIKENVGAKVKTE